MILREVCLVVFLLLWFMSYLLQIHNYRRYLLGADLWHSGLTACPQWPTVSVETKGQLMSIKWKNRFAIFHRIQSDTYLLGSAVQVNWFTCYTVPTKLDQAFSWKSHSLKNKIVTYNWYKLLPLQWSSLSSMSSAQAPFRKCLVFFLLWLEEMERLGQGATIYTSSNQRIPCICWETYKAYL